MVVESGSACRTRAVFSVELPLVKARVPNVVRIQHLALRYEPREIALSEWPMLLAITGNVPFNCNLTRQACPHHQMRTSYAPACPALVVEHHLADDNSTGRSCALVDHALMKPRRECQTIWQSQG